MQLQTTQPLVSRWPWSSAIPLEGRDQDRSSCYSKWGTSLGGHRGWAGPKSQQAAHSHGPYPASGATSKQTVECVSSKKGFMCLNAMLNRFSCVWLFARLWTVAQQTPLSMGFSKQEYWSGLPCPSPGDPPNPGTEPESLTCPALASRSLPLAPPGKQKEPRKRRQMAQKEATMPASRDIIQETHLVLHGAAESERYK